MHCIGNKRKMAGPAAADLESFQPIGVVLDSNGNEK